jgi:hypothetical protein
MGVNMSPIIYIVSVVCETGSVIVGATTDAAKFVVGVSNVTKHLVNNPLHPKYGKVVGLQLTAFQNERVINQEFQTLDVLKEDFNNNQPEAVQEEEESEENRLSKELDIILKSLGL